MADEELTAWEGLLREFPVIVDDACCRDLRVARIWTSEEAAFVKRQE
jgi:hypothetical protein